ncbi:MAG: response regulator [Bdellovibrionia bacterium]
MELAKVPVLVVDDMALSRKRVINCLKDLGFSDIREAQDGDDGWTAIVNAERPIVLVVSDWNMPHSSGLELVLKIRADEKYKSIVFVMVTAEGDAIKKTDAVKAGVNGIINKPFDSQIFSEKFNEILSASKIKLG